jgi:prepilin-type N-terminal cleavage/methylation domain-containing protein
MNRYAHAQSGFTLIEMLVSIALFAIVMVVCIGALLSLVGANKKAQALESVMNNLNISLDDMVRSIREGTNFNGSSGCASNAGGAHDCTGGTQTFSFAPYGTNTSQSYAPTIYEYVTSGSPGCTTTTGQGGCIMRSEGGGPFSSLTAPEVSITSMEFYVIGTIPGDTLQPRVIITISGTAGGTNVKTSTTFHLQATALQRALDL